MEMEANLGKLKAEVDRNEVLVREANDALKAARLAYSLAEADVVVGQMVIVKNGEKVRIDDVSRWGYLEGTLVKKDGTIGMVSRTIYGSKDIIERLPL